MSLRKPWFIVLALTLTLIGSTVTPIKADELSDLLAKQRELEKAQQQTQNKLKNLKIAEEQKKMQLEQISSQIVVAEANVIQKELAYVEAQADVEVSEKELLAKQEELDGRREALRKRVRGIYEEGRLSYLEILFQSTDLGDFITRMEYFEKLVDNDQKILTDINEQKEVVAQKTIELKDKRDLAARLKKEAEAAKAALDSKKRQEQKSLAEVKDAQEDLFVQMEKLEKDAKAVEETIRRLSKGTVVGSVSTWPVSGYYTISSPFGWRTHPITRKRSLHTGVDIPAPNSTPIITAGAGTVIYSGWYGAYGNTVIIDHGKSYSTLYAHQSKIGVSSGQTVKAGQRIGYVGSTGWSTGPHLHFEIRIDGKPTDPLPYVR